jgi:hypothetical protein
MADAAHPASVAAPVAARNWLQDFEFGWGGVLVRKTGAYIPFTPHIIGEVFAWFSYFAAVHSEPRMEAPAFTVSFTPDRARPWYLVWPVMRVAGARIVGPNQPADLTFHFEDATVCAGLPPSYRAGETHWNGGCRDVSKSRVASIFAEVFGYGLMVDPEQHHGAMVEKSETNGVHDGKVVQGPAPARPGRTYQRLIDNRSANEQLVEDFRTPMIGGRPAVVFIKRRPIGCRFTNDNTEVALTTPEEAFSADEIAKLSLFAERMGMDWGGLDVLRDRRDGRIYVVDANKTDMGPPLALPLADKMLATRRMAQALRARLTEIGIGVA